MLLSVTKGYCEYRDRHVTFIFRLKASRSASAITQDRQRIIYKLAVIGYRTLNRLIRWWWLIHIPQAIHLIHDYVPARTLQSSDK